MLPPAAFSLSDETLEVYIARVTCPQLIKIVSGWKIT